jgi:plasmid stability protein
MRDLTTNLTVRALPAQVRATLIARAKARRQSLNAYLLDVLTREAETPTMQEVLADINRIRRPTGLTTDDAVTAVRAVRDAEDAKWG